MVNLITYSYHSMLLKKKFILSERQNYGERKKKGRGEGSREREREKEKVSSTCWFIPQIAAKAGAGFQPQLHYFLTVFLQVSSQAPSDPCVYDQAS